MDEAQSYMFSPRLRPLVGHERTYSAYKMNRMCVQSSTYECKYKTMTMIKYSQTMFPIYQRP